METQIQNLGQPHRQLRTDRLDQLSQSSEDLSQGFAILLEQTLLQTTADLNENKSQSTKLIELDGPGGKTEPADSAGSPSTQDTQQAEAPNENASVVAPQQSPLESGTTQLRPQEDIAKDESLKSLEAESKALPVLTAPSSEQPTAVPPPSSSAPTIEVSQSVLSEEAPKSIPLESEELQSSRPLTQLSQETSLKLPTDANHRQNPLAQANFDAQASDITKVAEVIHKLASEDTPKLANSSHEQAPTIEKNAASKAPIVAIEAKSESKITQEGSMVDAKVSEALAAEDERVRVEAKRAENIERQRSIDEARVRVLVQDKGATQSGLGGGGFAKNSDQGSGKFSGRAPLAAVASTPSSNPSPAAAFASQLQQASPTPEKAAQPPAKKLARMVLEQARELTKSRRVDLQKMNLTIQLDEANEVKIRFAPRGDGTHELAFMVGNHKLKDELQRALPEIRDIATELPLTITDILFGDWSSTESEMPDTEYRR